MGWKRALSVHRDKNEKPLLKVARKLGATWIPMHGKDQPDGVLGWRGQNILIEFKNPEGFDSISDGQSTFHKTWRGSPVHVIRTEAELLALMKVRGA